MPRYKTDLHSIIKTGRLNQKHFLIVASQIIDVLMHLHGKNYVHSDIKAENIMIGLCKTENEPSKSKSLLNQHEIANAAKKFRVKGSDFHSSVRKSHNLRPSKSIAYIVEEEYSRSSHGPDSNQDDNSEQDEDFEVSPKKIKAKKSSKLTKNKRNHSELPTKIGPKKAVKSLFCKPSSPSQKEADNNERVYVIDYGLATKFINTIGEKTLHKPFCCDERRAHDGTLEFTSRDAHFGAHSRRSDLECLGYL
jgi:serine/threonine protein kinase